MLKLLSKRCCEIAWFPLPCHFKSLETFVLNVLPNVLRLLSIPSLGRLINFFSVTTNKLSLDSIRRKERESRAKKETIERSTIKEICKDGGSIAPPFPLIEDVDFHPAVASIHRLHFSFRGYCRRSRECRLKRPSWPLAMKWQCCTLRGQENPSIHGTAPFFSPFAGPPLVRGHHPIHEIPPLCNANASR